MNPNFQTFWNISFLIVIIPDIHRKMIDEWKIHILKKEEEKRFSKNSCLSSFEKKATNLFNATRDGLGYDSAITEIRGGMKSRLLTRNESETGRD